MLRGTRVIKFEDANLFVNVVDQLRRLSRENGFGEVIFPSIWETSTFTTKLGAEKEGQMWTFQDKAGRDCCLVPEITGIAQELWRTEWNKQFSGPLPIFYVQRCYRYERPQAGRYREFNQFGVEILGDTSDTAMSDVKSFLKKCVESFGIEYRFQGSVKRGLSYYLDDGFEVEVETLGAQKQIAGGGRYAEGVGFAIGLERMIMSMR
jgi:histidyl-tRNA synthetase